MRDASTLVTTRPAQQRLRVVIRGAVQGVGFRPFVYRLARSLGLRGWVSNSGQGVLIEVEGEEAVLEDFLLRLEREKPAIAFIQSLESSRLDAAGLGDFAIHESAGGEKTALVLPDIATCPDCLREVFDPGDRRWRYPFTNCTNCGPRFSIVESLPYDRARTTMRGFAMCPECESEYHDPANRRFHAQPNACPACGPQLALWDRGGEVLAMRDEALQGAAEAIRNGAVVAVKGLGGFHLMVDARSEAAIGELRRRKRREEKPFALMFPSAEAVLAECECSPIEQRMLRAPDAPIVLLRRRAVSELPRNIAPGNPYLGVLLPSTPLHHLLLRDLGFPVVATSGNLAEEPICTDEREALARLHGVAGAFLVHNRPILRHVDDSIARQVAGRPMLLRRARGFAPLPVEVAADAPPLLAVGAHQKNTIAASVGRQVFISQHIGDLETPQSLAAFERVIGAFHRLYELHPSAVACDLHPDYASTAFARRSGLPVVAVQHHEAHVWSSMAENQIAPPVLGVAWDGSGYGPDGTVWGGEFLRVTARGCERMAHLRTFRLPGGEKAVREPRRVALAVLYEIFGEAAFALDLEPTRALRKAELALLRGMLARQINSPLTSSVGRLFDAVAALIGVRQTCYFEGQAAMELEFAAAPGPAAPYDFTITPAGSPLVVDWEPMIRAILDEGAAPAVVAARFHATLAAMVVEVARRAGEPKVCLTGGCFQNKLLSELCIQQLTDAGFRPYWHQRVPPNDGGIALGQIAAAAARIHRE